MTEQSYSTRFLVNRSPQEVFEAVNRVPDWWSGAVEGTWQRVGDEFTYTVSGVHRSRQIVEEVILDRKVVWRVGEAHLSFVSEPAEWVGTQIEFLMEAVGDQTELRFTHRGLVPEFECHEACSNAWGLLVGGNLRNLILTGVRQPSPW